MTANVKCFYHMTTLHENSKLNIWKSIV